MSRLPRRRSLLLVASLAAVAAGVIANGVSAEDSEPGGSLTASGSFRDQDSGLFMGFTLHADEETGQAGRGGTFFELGGPGITACDAHGPGAVPGTTPLTAVECGGSGGVRVAVDNCVARIETHGIVHSDWPWTVYLGTMTVVVEFRYNPDRSRGRINVEIFTPKDVIELGGTTSGPVTMDTCPASGEEDD